MVTPRGWVAPAGFRGTLHVISRCTRRAWLLHGEHAHRKDWICRLAGELLADFRIDLHAYAVMANHVHLILRPRPDLVASLSGLQVAEAGHRTMPVRGGNGRAPLPATAELHARMAAATAWQEEYRSRLGSVSWFMRCLKQRIAQRANAESDCRGHFWESRFLSIPLLDLGAVVGCMAYVDANPFRARTGGLPEAAPYASLRARFRPQHLGEDEAVLARHLTPLAQVQPVEALTGRLEPCSLDEPTYLRLVHAGCGLVRDEAVSASLLACTPASWEACLGESGRFQGVAVGSGASRRAMAQLLGRQAIRDGAGLW